MKFNSGDFFIIHEFFDGLIFSINIVIEIRNSMNLKTNIKTFISDTRKKCEFQNKEGILKFKSISSIEGRPCIINHN